MEREGAAWPPRQEGQERVEGSVAEAVCIELLNCRLAFVAQVAGPGANIRVIGDSWLFFRLPSPVLPSEPALLVLVIDMQRAVEELG